MTHRDSEDPQEVERREALRDLDAAVGAHLESTGVLADFVRRLETLPEREVRPGDLIAHWDDSSGTFEFLVARKDRWYNPSTYRVIEERPAPREGR